jgi:hypothetical protein
LTTQIPATKSQAEAHVVVIISDPASSRVVSTVSELPHTLHTEAKVFCQGKYNERSYIPVHETMKLVAFTTTAVCCLLLVHADAKDTNDDRQLGWFNLDQREGQAPNPVLPESAKDSTQDEDEAFWPRMLGESMDSLTSPPTPNPSPAPSPGPSPAPSPPPSGMMCTVDLEMTCQTEDDDTKCTELEGEEQLECTCAECVRELRFTYTANLCDQDFEGCVDQPGPDDSSILVIANAEAPSQILYNGPVSIGDEVVVGSRDGSCIPDNKLLVAVSPLTEDDVTQMSTIDSSCDGRELSLMKSYGALDFTGYSCDESDVHNCYEDVVYNLTVCNVG